MMFAKIVYPENLSPEELDTYLANGWFRMRQAIFTTHFLHFNKEFYSAVWLRVVLDDAVYDKKFCSLVKLNSRFQVKIKKDTAGAISAQHESLYQDYRQSISFDVSATLRELLMGSEGNNRFNTYEVNIYDGSIMIAAGFFDLGKTSAAGITCIYHPNYKKYSLGKYLMYLKMDFCKKQQLQYFYPGYMVPGYKAFDYKLDIGKKNLQYLQLANLKWLQYKATDTVPHPLRDMIIKLGDLEPVLEKKAIAATLLFYQFFEANLDPFYKGEGLIDFPVFMFCLPKENSRFYTLIVFDVCDGKYHLLQCSSVMNIGFQQRVPAVFDWGLLELERELYVSSRPVDLANYLAGVVNEI